MYKVTVKCIKIEAEELAKLLEKKVSWFRIWFYDKVTYASFILMSLGELAELNKVLNAYEGSRFDCIKIEKVKRFWPS
jgi:muconolactone delta-isomerase